MRPDALGSRLILLPSLLLLAALALAAADGEPTPSIRAVMHKQYTVFSAPFKAIGREADARAPDWEKAGRAAEKYTSLATVLTGKVPPEGTRESWRDLIDRQLADARSMEEATRSRDAVALRAAQKRIEASCKACHDAHRPARGR